MARMPKKLDYAAIRTLAEIHCTDREIAAVIGLTPEWLCKRKKTDELLLEAIESARECGKMSLRRMQWKKAEEGNTTMLIWLGKQILGQRDRVEHSDLPVSGDGVPPDELSEAELKAIIMEELRKADAVVKKT